MTVKTTLSFTDRHHIVHDVVTARRRAGSGRGDILGPA